MKVGNLVKYKNLHGHVTAGEFISKQWIGIVLEEWGVHLKILWSTGTMSEESKSALTVIDESR
jgi:hypothetical protein